MPPNPACRGGGTFDGVDWQITADGELIIGKEGETQRYDWNTQRSYTGESVWPWLAYANEVTSIRFAGTVEGYGSHYCMFYGMRNATTIDLTNFKTWGVYNFGHMFRGCSSVTELDLSGFDTSYASSMQYMFSYCPALTSIDVSNFNTSKVADMSYMFYGDNSLQSLDISSFDTSQVKNMERMFGSCQNLEELTFDPNKFDTSKVENFNYMFYNCLKLSALDVSKFNTSSATTMDSMFYNCFKVTELDVSGFDTSKVENMQQMFSGCLALKSLDLSNFSAESLVYMKNMLSGLIALEEFTISDFPLNGTGFHGTGGRWTDDYDEMTAEQLKRIREDVEKKTYPRTTIETDESPLYYAYGLGEGNMWEVHDPAAAFRGYCMNQHRGTAYGSYNKVRVEDDAVLEELFDTADKGSTHGFEPLGSNMREALIALIYWTENGGHYEQADIWHFTNGYRTSTWEKDPTGHTYADIPNAETYVLYLYKSQMGYQNLLSIEGLNPQPYGGVAIRKVDQDGNPVRGAVFGVFAADGAQVATITSNIDGVAGIFRMSAEDGLPLGTYSIRELEAPRGYTARTTTYRFTVTKDQELVKISTTGTALTFTNDADEVPGGGIAVKKVNERGDALSGAEFTIYDANGVAVCVIATDGTGYALTGAKDLELNQAYTLRETKAPIGYLLSSEEVSFTLTEDGQFYLVNGENVRIVDTSKKGSATIEATKVLEGADLKDGQFTFALYAADADGNVTGEALQTATNTADGKVSFSAITYDATSLGYVNYVIREVAGTSSAFTYDTHDEKVTVLVEDNGGEALVCTVAYDSDGATFTNTGRQDIHFSKVDIAGEEIVGAQVQILNAEGEVVEAWTSDGTSHVTHLAPGTYTFHEMFAPEGFVVATDIKFTVDEDGLATIDGQNTSAANNTITMEDAYAPITANIQVQKQLEGRRLAAGEFRFTLVADAAEYASGEKGAAPTPAQTSAANMADGLVTFEPIEFSRPGTYTYSVHEVVPAGAQLASDGVTLIADGVAYSQAVHEVSVEVSWDAKANSLVARVVDDAHPGQLAQFTNIYTAGKAVATIVAEKTLTGAKLEEGMFEFELYEGGAAAGTPLDTVSNAADGAVAFDVLAFSDAGEYTYTIVEKNTGKEGYTYDETSYQVVVRVEDDGKGNLVAEVVYPAGGVKFANTYSEPTPEPEPEPEPAPTPEPTPEPSEPVDVVLTKHLIDALIHAEEFSFGLYDSEGNLLDTVYTTLGTKNNAEAYSSIVEIAFKGLRFDAAGTYTYTIREHTQGTTEVVEGDEWNLAGFEPGFYKGGVKYDDKEYLVVISVVENSEGKLEATVSYPNGSSGGESAELYNEYSEEYVEIDGNDSHPFDGLHEPEPEPAPEPDNPQPKPEPEPVKVTQQPRTNNPTSVVTPTPKAGSVRTEDTNPVAPLAFVALVAASAAGFAFSRRRGRE